MLEVGQDNNHAQEHKYLREKPFLLEGKTMRQTPNNFTIIKSITISLVYVSRLKKNLSFFVTLTHTNYLSQRQQHFTLFSLLHSFLLVVFFFSKQLPLGHTLNSLVWHPFLLSLCSTHQNIIKNLVYYVTK